MVTLYPHWRNSSRARFEHVWPYGQNLKEIFITAYRHHTLELTIQSASNAQI